MDRDSYTSKNEGFEVYLKGIPYDDIQEVKSSLENVVSDSSSISCRSEKGIGNRLVEYLPWFENQLCNLSIKLEEKYITPSLFRDYFRIKESLIDRYGAITRYGIRSGEEKFKFNSEKEFVKKMDEFIERNQKSIGLV